nr:two-pore potassium channel 4-like [Malus domestica]
MSVFQCIIKFQPVNVIGGGAMHRQSRAIFGGGGEGIGGREGREVGAVGGRSWAWKLFSWPVLSIAIYIFFFFLSVDFVDLNERLPSEHPTKKSVKALFLMSETLTGVGYGDIVPNTERAKFSQTIWFCGVSEDIFRVVMAIAAPAVCVGVGCVGFHLLEKLSWEDALYLSVVSATTVGYGEIPVKTASTKGSSLCRWNQSSAFESLCVMLYRVLLM